DGDSDGDGVFDSNDLCVETRDPAQLDGDGDGLGDRCDPNPCPAYQPPAPPAAPAALNACQDAIGKGAETLFRSYSKAVVACLDKMVDGKIGGDPDVVCRGAAGNPIPVLPTDETTAVKIFKAALQYAAAMDKKCTSAQVSSLDACGSTVNG